jgi:hypothetical protein
MVSFRREAVRGTIAPRTITALGVGLALRKVLDSLRECYENQVP